ncbi:MFS transporter [Burkholderia sp. Ac-20379]|uniref:MFS transporter n=1 Tax=Burkholderia sp. Ac-20379 TaxID=2703900 RepID=UPI00197D0281|nr:MFS transporter [Burkholderia sp. Ac-20379]MBN3725152.1 MFS transporter [Burkholderia sp. Ac-20379]
MNAVDERAVLRKTAIKLIPFLFLLYIVSYIDRTNVGFAALQMNRDLGLTPAMYGLGAGIFFIGMLPFEVPSNLLMVKFGARVWLARIMVVWGFVTLATSMIAGPNSFYAVRFLLGVSEAGFFPGVLFFLTFWFPREYRTQIIARFMISLPVAAAIGGPVSSLILQAFDGLGGIPGWRWLFIVEGIPAIVLGVVTYRILLERPSQARWLTAEQRNWLQAKIDREQAEDLADGDPHSAAHVFKVLLDWRTLVVTFTGVCFVIGFYGAGFWLPQIIKTFHVSTLQVGLLSALPNLLGAGAMLLWSRRCRNRALRLSDVAQPLVLSCVAFVVAAYNLGNPVIAMSAFCVAMIGLYACMPAYWTLPTMFFSGTAAAAVLAFVNAVSNLGGFFGPTIIGWLTQTSGSFRIAIATMGGFVLVGAIALVLLVPAFSRMRAAPEARAVS